MMGLTEPLHRAVFSTPDKIATINGTRVFTWSEFKDRVARLAGGLQSLGVKDGDRVAILSLNSDRYFEAYYAVWWLGAVVVPMNIRWSAAENIYSLTDSGASAIFVDAQFSALVPQMMDEAAELKTLIFMDDGETPQDMHSQKTRSQKTRSQKIHRQESLAQDSLAVADARKSGEDLAGIFYTGGTTGFPKGVMLPHRALWFNGLAISKQLFTTQETRYLHTGPMFHLADKAASLAVTMVGGTHLFLPMFSPEGVMETIEQQNVSHTLLVPTMIGMTLQSPNYDPKRFKSMTHLIYGGSPIPEGHLKQMIKELPNIGLINAYGQTEMAPLVSTLDPKHHVLDDANGERYKSVGQLAPGIEARIVDETGKDVKRGNVGEIWARSPGSMQGYWNKPEQTAKTLNDGWVKTGDGARMDKDGFIYIVDRVKDMVITGGENVFSAEVENAVSTFTGVVQVAIIGIPDERWGEAVHAIIVTADGAPLDKDAILSHCRGLLANYKLPRSIEFRTEPMPLSGAGKVLKRQLRKPYWDKKTEGVS